MRNYRKSRRSSTILDMLLNNCIDIDIDNILTVELPNATFPRAMQCRGQNVITKTRLYNFEPLKPHFYTVKLGLTGVYVFFFLFLLKNIDCGYSLEPPHRTPQSMFLTSAHNLCFEQKYEKYQNFYLKIFKFCW